ncbi:pyrimidine-nucleoside phosphorylase [Alkalibaculum sp. M08DMB]|uniref:Pyrimidine-nucleoside phosphorylase n=1 Tax=Alkalibaculum sporogenes TaxID=2655001 RepID=A0A6A7KBI5_9FIRM|nr:pyrimidine-nucleoside phosphorylase [Alkalibaculum sporogenes]MPW26919.1 pyrimidine-nucleoside phosphorylase [Alkalibaculum sporogenes]
MRMYDIILKKRQGQALTTEEINYFVDGFTKGEIPDYQTSALLMTIFFSKMNHRETVDLTKAMINSGDVMNLSGIKGVVVDKHSTGGVGDTTTLILGPMVAACGIPMAKMSGRGLGHTGGTIDKLESINGFNTQMTKEEFIYKVNKIGIAIAGQTSNLAPADKQLYALRDVTATVDNLSLIASSVMSKKLASGAQGILLDVKTGHGAFMKTQEDSFELAQMMIDIGNAMGRNVSAIITDMNQPLGRAVGNSLEVKEAIDTLRGNGPEDLYKLCLALGTELLILAGYTNSPDKALQILQKKVEGGEAFEKFRDLVKSQGGSIEQVDNTELLPQGKYKVNLLSDKNQYIKSIKAEEVGLAALTLGAGRQTKESKIDLGVGIYLHKKVGDFTNKGELIATIYANDEEKSKLALNQLSSCYEYSLKPVEEKKLIYGIINKDGTQLIK